MSVTASAGCFLKNGKPYFLISGEIHYFRVDPELWERHLILLKKSGANTTSTYIPWDWHEYEEGKCDFSGDTDPRRNLLRYIGLCKKVGLELIVKPGPYILAEYEMHGLPGWFVRKAGRDHLALDDNGAVIAPDIMSYMSQEYLRQAFRWYDQVMPIIARHQQGRGGPITAMQVCNEVGVFQWLSGRIDYSDTVMVYYRRFLSQKYRMIEGLNALYGTKYPAFEDVMPPRGLIANREQYRAYYDFHLFYRSYFEQYLDTLVSKVRSFGIDVLVTHNIPGWIYGNASELPMLISTYSEVMRLHPEFVFGLDHIPEYFSFRNAHSDLACNKILEAMQSRGPVWAAEFQAGTREHHVRSYARDLEAFYLASVAHGLKGFNYYMFSQGLNPQGKGFYGKTFYYQTPLDATGKRSSLYPAAKRIADFINREGEHLLRSKTHAAICAGFYKPYFFTELTTSQLLREKRLNVRQLGLTLDPRYVREELFFNGLLRGLQTLNFQYDILDLQSAGVEALLAYRQLWMVTTEFMDAATQSLLASYVQKGGNLILYPAVPHLDEYLNPCTVLKDELGLDFDTGVYSNKVDAFGIEDVFTPMREMQIFRVSSDIPVAATKTGEACGIRKRVGNGWITALGFAFGYTTDEHLYLIEKIISHDGITREVRVSDPDVQFVVRRGKKFAYLFLINYHNERKTFTVDGKRHTLPPFSCRVSRRPRKARR